MYRFLLSNESSPNEVSEGHVTTMGGFSMNEKPPTTPLNFCFPKRFISQPNESQNSDTLVSLNTQIIATVQDVVIAYTRTTHAYSHILTNTHTTHTIHTHTLHNTHTNTSRTRTHNRHKPQHTHTHTHTHTHIHVITTHIAYT